MAEKTTAFTGPVVVGLNDKKGEIRLTDGKNVNEAKYLSIAAPDTITSDTTLTFPNGAGTAGQILSTDGSGNLIWVNDSAGNPDGTSGQVQFNDNGTFGAIPDGTSGQVLTSNGAGVAPSFQEDTSGIAAVVDDTTPELGGDLASNGHDINFADNDKAKFGDSGDLEIYHDGSNSIINDSGTGQLKISGFDAVKITNSDDTIPMAQFISSGEAQLYYAGNQKLATNTNGIQTTGNVNVNGAYTLPTSDGTANQVLTTDGGGNVTFQTAASSGIAAVVDDTTPQLGGNLDLNSNSITGTGNLDIANGTIKLDGPFPTGVANTCFGNQAGQSMTSTAQLNTFIGYNAGDAVTTGDNNTAVAVDALSAETNGSNNTCLGRGAGSLQNGGFNNTFIGAAAGLAGRTNNNVICIGNQADPSSGSSTNEITLGNANITSLRIPGLQSGASTNDVLTFNGTDITLAAPAAADPITSSLDVGSTKTIKLDAVFPDGTRNSFLGENAGASITTADSNVGIGFGALENNLTGNENVAIGRAALGSSTGGASNIAIGGISAASTAGGNNVCIGSGAASNMSAFSSENVIIGRGAANGSVSGAVRSVIIGDIACINNAPSDAVAIGANTMSSTSGQYNTAVGQSSGSSIGTGTNNTCLGYNADPSTSGVSNEITLGDAAVTSLRCQTTSITSLSDARDKKDVEDANIGLDFINDLRPVKFVWDTRDGAKKDIKEVGFIAQELDEVQQKHGVEDHLQLVLKNNPDKLEASQGKLIPILVQAIKDLKKEIDELKKA